MMWGKASCAGPHLSGGICRLGFEDRVEGLDVGFVDVCRAGV